MKNPSARCILAVFLPGFVPFIGNRLVAVKALRGIGTKQVFFQTMDPVTVGVVHLIVFLQRKRDHSFVQFLLPYYSEIHIVDLRTFGMNLSQYVEQEGITDMLVLYNLKGFSEEASVYKIAK